MSGPVEDGVEARAFAQVVAVLDQRGLVAKVGVALVVHEVLLALELVKCDKDAPRGRPTERIWVVDDVVRRPRKVGIRGVQAEVRAIAPSADLDLEGRVVAH